MRQIFILQTELPVKETEPAQLDLKIDISRSLFGSDMDTCKSSVEIKKLNYFAGEEVEVKIDIDNSQVPKPVHKVQFELDIMLQRWNCT